MLMNRSKIAVALGILVGLVGGGCGRKPGPVAPVSERVKSPEQLALECGLREPLLQFGGSMSPAETDSLSK
ncbi:MAG: hypothetical protein U0931_23875, partial [Vulcanimicrobiota bacterium]